MKLELSTKILLFILVLLVSINLFITLKKSDLLEVKINKSIAEIDEKLKKVDNLKDGYTPIKNIDYRDGRDGKDSISTNTVIETKLTKEIVKQVPIKGEKGDPGQNGINGSTPELQCNVLKNRWEIKYLDDNGWKILNGTPVKCTL